MTLEYDSFNGRVVRVKAQFKESQITRNFGEIVLMLDDETQVRRGDKILSRFRFINMTPEESAILNTWGGGIWELK